MSAKLHSTNYFDTFIEVASDCLVKAAEIPPQKSEPTVARIEYEMIFSNPYKYTSDDVLFKVFVIKNNIAKENWDKEREKFFSKGQPCFRSSPLTKRYGWGVHSNTEGKIAIFGVETPEYKKLLKENKIKHLQAMRTKKE